MTTSKRNHLLGEKIKHLMNEQNISYQELISKSNLPRSSVDNVFYGKSKQRDKVQAIADALGVSVDLLTDVSSINLNPSASSPLSSNVPYDGKVYRKVITLVEATLTELSIKVTKKHLMDSYIEDTYFYVMSEGNTKVGSNARAYLKGIVHTHMKLGILQVF